MDHHTSVLPFTLAGNRITLRDFTVDDVDAVSAYASDPKVTQHLIWGPETHAQTEEWLQQTIEKAQRRPRHHFELGIMENASECLIGGARIAVRSQAHGVGDIGYGLRHDAWGKGFATEAAQLLIHFGFGSLGLHRIEAICDPSNAASRRVLEKSGMQSEGRSREYLWVRGQWRDSLLYAILDKEYRSSIDR